MKVYILYDSKVQHIIGVYANKEEAQNDYNKLLPNTELKIIERDLIEDNKVTLSKWISIKDKMPAENVGDYVGRYLVYIPNFTSFNMAISRVRGGKFYERTATHWMPLPNPPERKSD